jgi:squalene-hopene/tetraprenyl-beta-curcumene cyclase
MGQEGLYYYFHTMAKALSAAGVDRFTLKDGRGVDWRRELALKLLSLQDGSEGFWVNTNGRWWEKDPVLTTAYSLIALEIVHRGL